MRSERAFLPPTSLHGESLWATWQVLDPELPEDRHGCTGKDRIMIQYSWRLSKQVLATPWVWLPGSISCPARLGRTGPPQFFVSTGSYLGGY